MEPCGLRWESRGLCSHVPREKVLNGNDRSSSTRFAGDETGKQFHDGSCQTSAAKLWHKSPGGAYRLEHHGKVEREDGCVPPVRDMEVDTAVGAWRGARFKRCLQPIERPLRSHPGHGLAGICRVKVRHRGEKVSGGFAVDEIAVPALVGPPENTAGLGATFNPHGGSEEPTPDPPACWRRCGDRLQ